MNLLNILHEQTKHINLNEMEVPRHYWFSTFKNLFEFLEENNIQLTREISEHERSVLLSHTFEVPRTAKNISVLKGQEITPEMLYALLDYIKLRHGYQAISKINAYLKRTMTSDALILATLYHMKNDTHTDMRMYNAILTSINLLDMPIDEVVTHISNDELVEIVDTIIAGKTYNRMSIAKTVQLLIKYIYNFDMTQEQFNRLKNAESTNYRLLSMLINGQEINSDKLNDFLSIQSPHVKHIEILTNDVD